MNDGNDGTHITLIDIIHIKAIKIKGSKKMFFSSLKLGLR